MNARVLFLKLSALGFEMRAREAPEDPEGFVVGMRGPAYGDELLERVGVNKAGLGEVLASRHDPDVEAVRSEGRTA